jgi:hypothetical protein
MSNVISENGAFTQCHVTLFVTVLGDMMLQALAVLHIGIGSIWPACSVSND